MNELSDDYNLLLTALTAYGLLEFVDMSKVYPVDPSLIETTKNWLLNQRDDASGGFKRNSRALDSFGAAPDDITNAYIGIKSLLGSSPNSHSSINWKSNTPCCIFFF